MGRRRGGLRVGLTPAEHNVPSSASQVTDPNPAPREQRAERVRVREAERPRRIGRRRRGNLGNSGITASRGT